MNASLQQFSVFDEDLSVDIQMGSYLWRHSCKMFIRGEPTRFGYINWVLASSCGYSFRFDTSVGASEMRRDHALSQIYFRLSKIHGSIVYTFDNFFFTNQLLVDLKEKQFRARGTIRENRLMKCLMASSKAVQKKNWAFTTAVPTKILFSCNEMTIKLFMWRRTLLVFSQ